MALAAGIAERLPRTIPRDRRAVLSACIRAAIAGGKVALAHHAHLDSLEVRTKESAQSVVSDADEDSERVIRRVLKKKVPRVGFWGEELGKDIARQDACVAYIDPVDGTTNFTLGNDPHWAVQIGVRYKNEDKPAVGVIYFPQLDKLLFAAAGGGAWLVEKPDLKPKRVFVNSKVDEASNAIVFFDMGAKERRVPLEKIAAPLVETTRSLQVRQCVAVSHLKLVGAKGGSIHAVVHAPTTPHDVAAAVPIVEEAGGKITDQQGCEILWHNIPPHFYYFATNGKIHGELLRHVNGNSCR